MSEALKALQVLQGLCPNDSRDAIQAEIAAVMSASQGDWPPEWSSDIASAVLAARPGPLTREQDAFTRIVSAGDISRSACYRVAAENGVSETTFDARLARGWSHARACSEPATKGGKPLDEWEKRAVENGRSVRSYRARLRLRPDNQEWASMPPNSL